MPSAARRFEERWKPSLAERLQQSQRDRRSRGAKKASLKRSEPERAGKIWRPGNEHFPTIQLFGNDFFVNNVTIDTSTHGNTRVLVTGISNAINSGTGTAVTFQTDRYAGLPLNQQTMELMRRETANAWYSWTSNQTAAVTLCSHDVWNTWHIQPVREYRAEWTRWVDTGTTDSILTFDANPRIERYRVIETEEEKKARLAREEQFRREREEENRRYQEQLKQQQEAEGRAMELLNSCLNKEQRGCLQKNGFFYVMAKSGRRYRIDKGTHGNVKVVDKDGRMLESLCIQPGGVPVGDSMLAQKLFIECHEDAFRRHANITLKDGTVLRGDASLLDGDKLGVVIPFRRAA